MKSTLSEIRQCSICSDHLPLGPRPVVAASKESKIIIIGQAPGTKVHASGVPWDDASGQELRRWLGITPEEFYDTSKIAIVPMGFCYPGKGSSGDLPPRPECAPQWHKMLLEQMKEVKLILLIGTYAQKYYLKDSAQKNLTETVRNFKDYLPKYFVLPHPSPRNRFWRTINQWFETSVIPELQKATSAIIS